MVGSPGELRMAKVDMLGRGEVGLVRNFNRGQPRTSPQKTFLRCGFLFGCVRVRILAAQCEIPPHIAQYPFESIAEGCIAPFCLVLKWYRASIAEIPLLWGGGIAPPLRMLSKAQGGDAQKRGRGYRTLLAIFRHQKPYSARNRGVSLR